MNSVPEEQEFDLDQLPPWRKKAENKAERRRQEAQNWADEPYWGEWCKQFQEDYASATTLIGAVPSELGELLRNPDPRDGFFVINRYAIRVLKRYRELLQETAVEQGTRLMKRESKKVGTTEGKQVRDGILRASALRAPDYVVDWADHPEIAGRTRILQLVFSICYSKW